MGAVRQPDATDPGKSLPAEPVDLVLVDPLAPTGPAPAPPPGQAAAGPVPAPVQGLVDQYLNEIRRDLSTPIAPPPPPPAVRGVYGGLALAATLLLAGVVAAVVLVWNTGLPVWSLEAVAAAPGGAACVARQEKVMAALAAYASDHGGLPPSLDSLRPQYLLEAPADPTSGRAFLYARDGPSVLLTCRDHPLAPHIEPHDTAPGVPHG